MLMSPVSLRADFPGLAGGWHYLDTAATAQKPKAVIDAARGRWARTMPQSTGAYMRARQT